jgi:hypothetical protein
MTTLFVLAILAGVALVYLKRAKIVSYLKSHSVTLKDNDSDAAE